jgi:hypothetical protein
MRFGGNFHPEWGALTPAPNFMRTARIVAVATAIGATAGAAVVLSLAGSPAPGPVADSGKSLVVVRSLVQPAEAAVATPVAPVALAAPVTPVAAPAAKQQASVQPIAAPVIAPAVPLPAGVRTAAPAPSDSHSLSTPAVPASVTALAESPPATTEASPAQASDDAAAAPDPFAPQPNANKKRRGLDQPAQHGAAPIAAGAAPIAAGPKKKPVAPQQGIAPILRRLFSAHNGSPASQN